jgi:hypothetical protein
MVAVRQKPATALQNTRGGRGRGVAVPGRPPGWKPPALPRAVTAKLADPVQAELQPAALKHAREVWQGWWRSAPAAAVDLESDREAIEWWITCVYRRALYTQVVLRQPMVRGSMGQPVVNPLEATVARLTRDIDQAADRFGMTTLARFRLHFEAQGFAEDPDQQDAEAEYREMLGA